MKHKYITSFGYVVAKENLTDKEQKDLIHDLTIKPLVLDCYKTFGPEKTYKIFLYNEKYFFLPLHYGLAKFGPYIKNELSPGYNIDIKFKGKLMQHQETAGELLRNTFDKTKHEYNNLLLQLYCGWGKTAIAIYTACILGLKTLVLVNKENLMDQFVESIKKFSNATVGIIQQDKLEVDVDICVAMIHTICLKDYPMAFYNQFGFLIIDEVHHIASELFIKSLMYIRPRFILGLSATPYRRDGLSHVFFKFIGNNIYAEKRKGNNMVLIKSIYIDSKTIEYETIYNSKKVKDTGRMITNLTNSEKRNNLIIEILELLIKEKRTILILSARREHLYTLHDLILKAKMLKNEQPIKIGFYFGRIGTNKNDHKKMLEESAKCDIILGTDAIAKEGLDIPSLNTLLFATPAGTDVEQAVGRILRKVHENIKPTVIDLVDRTGNFDKHFKERMKWYNGEEYEIIYMEILLEKYDIINLLNFINNGKSDYIIKSKIKIAKEKIKKMEEEAIFDNCLLEDDRVDKTNTINKTKIIEKMKKNISNIEQALDQKNENIFANCLL
jgi:superfamily II DNA or RNA helicase